MEDFRHKLSSGLLLPKRGQKLLLLTSPFSIDKILALQIFDQHSRSRDEVAYRLMRILRHRHNYYKYLDLFLKELDSMLLLSLVETTKTELEIQTYMLAQNLRTELETFEMYQNDELPFNTMWFDRPDTISFFKMEQKDI